MPDSLPMPDDPNIIPVVGCESVPTRLENNADDEIKGKLFERDCEGLDKTLDRKRDQFINNCVIPDPPKGKLYMRDYPPESFPGAPPIEVPKNLITALLFGDSKNNHIPKDFIKYPVYCHPRSKFLMKESDGTFSEVDLAGNRLSYDPDDTNKRIPGNKVKKAPYLTSTPKGGESGGGGSGDDDDDDTTPGHIYNAEWSAVNDCWVITGGDCEESNYAYTPYIVVRVSGHFVELNKQDGPDISGYISIPDHGTPTTFEYTQLGIYDIEGSEATHEDLFATEPIFTLGGGGDSIVYTNIRLNPGRAGIVLYRFILYYCNGAERDVYIVAFKCVESNYAPVYEPIISTIQVKEEEEYDKIVGKITDLDNDEVTISEQEVEGEDILSDLELTVDDNNNVHLKFTAIKNGTAKISFIPDDGHNKIATYGFYERHSIYIYVGDTNLAPVVTITEPVIPLAVYNGGLKEMVIGTVTDADATVEGDANYIIEMIRYGIPQDLIKGEVFIRNGKLMVKVNDLGKDSLYTGHGEEDIVFRVHDVRQKYKDGMPDPVSFKFTLDTSIEYDPITTEVTMAPKQKLGKISFGKVTANYGSEYPAFRQYKLIILSENLPDSAVHGTASMDANGNVFAKNVVAGEEEGEYTFRGKVVDRYGNETNVFTVHFTVTNE